jgi:hypothetical protein
MTTPDSPYPPAYDGGKTLLNDLEKVLPKSQIIQYALSRILDREHQFLFKGKCFPGSKEKGYTFKDMGGGQHKGKTGEVPGAAFLVTDEGERIIASAHYCGTGSEHDFHLTLV